MNATVILNAAAGSAAKLDDSALMREIGQALASAGIAADLQVVPPGQITSTLRDVLAARPSTVIVGGGDGTIRCAAELVVDTKTRLGVLPLGTLNHFAKDLGIPSDWREAVGSLAQAREVTIDVGEVNGRVFLNNCSLGAYAEAVRRRDALRRNRSMGKWRAMFHAGVATFRRFPRFRLRLEGAGPTRALRIPLLVVGNNRYSGHVLDASLRPRLDQGRLWIYTAHVHRPFAFFRLLWQSLVRGFHRADDLDASPATQFTVTSESGNLPVALDGEQMELLGPLHFRIRPRALRVLACPPS